MIMSKQQILIIMLSAAVSVTLNSCTEQRIAADFSHSGLMTVRGAIPLDRMGPTLTHEHLILDMNANANSAEKRTEIDYLSVSQVILPELEKIEAKGIRTLIDNTAVGFGRYPQIIKRLSSDSGLNIVIATGAYLAAGPAYAPEHVIDMTAEELSALWTEEFLHGLRGTDIRPGFIKLGIAGGKLSDLEQKVVQAAAMTHPKTGLTIAVHIGPWSAVEPGELAEGAKGVISILSELNVSSSAFIWVHAQNETNSSALIEAAELGAFISLDTYRPGTENVYVQLLKQFKEKQLLSQIHLSQDAGWYSIGEENGGSFVPYDPILNQLLPHLYNNNFTKAEVDMILVSNPARAFGLSKRMIPK